MLNEILSQAIDQWIRAKHQKKHPFRYFVLTTVNSAKAPESRTVVLRDFDASSMEFVVYTDARSKKVEALQKNQKVQLLFFDPKRLWQLTVAAELKAMCVAPEIFKQLPPASKKDYTVRLAPGTPIANPNDIEYQEESFFYHLTFTANKIESLRLKRPNHLRAVFEKEQQWKGKFLTP